MKKYKAVLFDFDGTLVKTMEDNFEAWKHAFSEFITLKPEDYYPLEGATLPTVAQEISHKYHINVNVRELADKKDAYYLSHHRFELYPGVDQLIKLLRSGNILIAIVTAGRWRRLKRSVPREFLDSFDVLITGDNVKGKPNPEAYLWASRYLEVKPRECIVIENAPFGIQAAKSAGMYCIAIPTTLDKSYLQQADEIVDTFDALKDSKVIKNICGL